MLRLRLLWNLLAVAFIGAAVNGCTYFGAGKKPPQIIYPESENVACADIDPLPNHCAKVIWYRPASQWAAAEWQAPSLYVNGEAAGSLEGGSALTILLEPGAHLMTFRRPLLGLERLWTWDFGRFLELELKLEPGETRIYQYKESRHHKGPIPTNTEFVSRWEGTSEQLASIPNLKTSQAAEPFYQASPTEEYRQAFDTQLTEGGPIRR